MGSGTSTRVRAAALAARDALQPSAGVAHRRQHARLLLGPRIEVERVAARAAELARVVGCAALDEDARGDGEARERERVVELAEERKRPAEDQWCACSVLSGLCTILTAYSAKRVTITARLTRYVQKYLRSERAISEVSSSSSGTDKVQSSAVDEGPFASSSADRTLARRSSVAMCVEIAPPYRRCHASSATTTTAVAAYVARLWPETPSSVSAENESSEAAEHGPRAEEEHEEPPALPALRKDIVGTASR